MSDKIKLTSAESVLLNKIKSKGYYSFVDSVLTTSAKGLLSKGLIEPFGFGNYRLIDKGQ